MKTFVALALLLPWPVLACLNNERPFDSANQTGGNNMAALTLRRAMAVKPSDLTAARKFGTPQTPEQKNQAQALNRIFAGDLVTAIAQLKAIEDQQPGQYSTAANLGTAYELTGDNVNALKWITKAIDINPNSHGGTEWLHVLILKAKIAAAKHPDRPLLEPLLGVPEQMQPSTQVTVQGTAYSVGKIRSALSYQLTERLVFVKPKDPYVADLLYSYALIEGNLMAVENGLGLLKLAREYGFPDEELLERQEERFGAIARRARIKWWATVTLSTAAITILLWYAHLKKWLFFSTASYKAHKRAMVIVAK